MVRTNVIRTNHMTKGSWSYMDRDCRNKFSQSCQISVLLQTCPSMPRDMSFDNLFFGESNLPTPRHHRILTKLGSVNTDDSVTLIISDRAINVVESHRR